MLKNIFQKRTPCPTFQNSKEAGQFGEEAAARFLKNCGYKVLAQNYTSEWGEIDLVCRHKDVLVFVEVKARDEATEERPARAVDYEKRKKIQKTARAYIDELYTKDMPTRFDIVEVYLKPGMEPQCELLANVFAD